MSGAKFRLPSTRLQYAERESSNFTFYTGIVAYGAFKFTLEHTVEGQSGSRIIAPPFLVEYAAISCVMLFRLSDISICLNLLYHFPPSLRRSAFAFLNYSDTGRLK